MKRLQRLAGLGLAALAVAASASAAHARIQAGTFSIVAFDSVTQELGVAVQSKYFNVGSVVPWAEGGVGAVATQATVNPSYGPQALALLRSGVAPAEILRAFAAVDTLWPSRQLGIVDARGRVASWTGPGCIDWAGGETGLAFACQGNILAGPAVVADMAKAFRETRGELAERLITALEAAQAAGGDRRGMQSAALIVVRPSPSHPEYSERYVDLRVEDHKSPIQELRRLWQIDAGFHLTDAHLQFAAEYAAAGRAAIQQQRAGQIR